MGEPHGVAVVTGASSGIARALTGEFARKRFELVICAEDAGIEAAADLRARGGRAARARRPGDVERVEQFVVAVRSVGGTARRW